ncbi:MAG: hypothetical protein AAGA18_15995, partial [Verrucomicrobiota bacterium]
LLLFMAGAISLSAMRGAYKYYLHNASSPRMKSAIKALQEEFEAQAKAEGRVVGDDVAKGVTQSAQVDAKFRSNKVMSQMFPDATAKGELRSSEELASRWNPFSKNRPKRTPDLIKKPWIPWHKIDAQIAAKDALDARTIIRYKDIAANDAVLGTPASSVYSGSLNLAFAQGPTGSTYLRINGIDLETLVAQLKFEFNKAYSEAGTISKVNERWRWWKVWEKKHAVDKVAWADHLRAKRTYAGFRKDFARLDDLVRILDENFRLGAELDSPIIRANVSEIMKVLENFRAATVPGYSATKVFKNDIDFIANTLTHKSSIWGRFSIPTQDVLEHELSLALKLFPVTDFIHALKANRGTDVIRLGSEFSMKPKKNTSMMRDPEYVSDTAGATFSLSDQVIRFPPRPIPASRLRELIFHETFHAWFHQKYPKYSKLNTRVRMNIRTQLALFFNEMKAYRAGIDARQHLIDSTSQVTKTELQYLAKRSDFQGIQGGIKGSIRDRDLALAVYYTADILYQVFYSLPKAGQEYLIKRPTDWMFR